MKKMAILNVGGALCVYMDIDGVRIMSDVGKSDKFNPVVDFLRPLAEKSSFPVDENGKFVIDQLIVSHPHEDHISAIGDFDESFSVGLLTCPNDKTENEDENDILDFSYFDEELEAVKTLRKMYKERKLPLTTKFPENGETKQFLFWLKPGKVVENSELTSNGECYQNNVSLVSLFKINRYWVLLPGDIMKNGMSELINTRPKFYRKLSVHGIDILIASHHGLKSSFSTYLFDTISGHKTRCLNIISEKVKNKNENREVDERYYSKDYCEGNNNLESSNGKEKNYGRKTSEGHVCIDFDNSQYPKIEVIDDTEDLIAWFMED